MNRVLNHSRPLSPSAAMGLFASVLSLASIGPAQAKALSVDPTGLPKASYRLDPHHTSVTMQVSHMGFSHYTLRFDKISGSLEYDPEDRVHPKLTVDIESKSVDSGDRSLDGEVAGAKFFDSARYPEIVFAAGELIDHGDGQGDLAGELTFHGVTRPVTLAVAFNGWGGDVIGRTTMGFSATTQIKRSDFGVKAYEGLVGDAVDLSIEAEFQKDGLLTRLLP
jgi:polyisoprenoid-binding protein YceI